METNNKKNENGELNQLVNKLKVKDLNYATLSRALQIIYFILIPLYILTTILGYTESKNPNELIGGGFFILSFIIFIIILTYYYKKYKNVDYSLPTVQMLKKAAGRYKLFQKYSVWSFLAIIVMDVGLFFNWRDEFPIYVGQIVFWSLFIVGITIGIIIWYKRYKPIRDEALRMIKEIEGE